MVWLAVEVSVAFDRTIILSRAFVELDTDPLSRRKLSRAQEADDCFAPIVQLNCLPYREGQACHCAR